jgi:DNA excision repair protein ERCC-6
MPANFGGQVPAFQQQPLPVLPPGCTTPLDYFKLFVDDKFVEDIAGYSQLYAARKNRPEVQKVLTPDAIRTSQAVMLLTGYMTPSTRAMFWEKREDTGNSFVKKAISRDNFRRVISCTYFVEGDKDKNNQDKFWKVRLLFDQLNKTAKKYVTATEMVCVDEAMIKYFGPHPLKQFIRGKPTRFGYKVWILATSAGQLLACQPYAGAKTLLPDFGLGMGPNVVYGLARQYSLRPGSKIACDNLFTSLDLLNHLGKLELGVVGTMRQNRVLNLPLPSKKDMEKNMERGDHRVLYSADGEICVVQWKDNKAVYLASNCFSVEPMGTVSRYNGADKAYKQIPCPRMIPLYNESMGGVDLLDGGEKRYAITTRVKKWYWPCYTWFLNVSMVQAWRLYRVHKKEENRLARAVRDQEDQAWEEEKKDQLKRVVDQERKAREQTRKEQEKLMKKTEEIPLLEFLRQAVELMVVEHSSTYSSPLPQSTIAARLSSQNLKAVRYDSGRHIIFKSEVKGVCSACKNRSFYRCERCEVALHPDCFWEFHSKDDS